MLRKEEERKRPSNDGYQPRGLSNLYGLSYLAPKTSPVDPLVS